MQTIDEIANFKSFDLAEPVDERPLVLRDQNTAIMVSVVNIDIKQNGIKNSWIKFHEFNHKNGGTQLNFVFVSFVSFDWVSFKYLNQ